MISLYKAYVLPHLDYCCPLLLGISKALKSNIERTNHYAIKTLLNLGNSATYYFCLALAAMDTLEQRHTPRSLILLRASLCKILISSFTHKMDFAHNFSVDFF